MDIKKVLLQWFINFLIKKNSSGTVRNKIILIKNQQKNYINHLLEKLRKEKYTHLLQTIFGTQIYQKISKYCKEFSFLLSVIDIQSKYAWVISLKDKKRTAFTNAYQKILDESKHKPNKIWVDKAANFITDQ